MLLLIWFELTLFASFFYQTYPIRAVNVIENIGAGILAASNGSGAEPVKTKTMTIASTPVNEKSKTEVTK